MKKLIILLTLNVLFAQVPQKMSFQAYLTDANNMPVAPGSYEMTFRIYDALTEGSKVWEESQTVTVDGSLVSVMLGNTVPLVALSSAGYLEIQLKDEVLSPRQELGGTMFAIRAVNADTAKIAVGYAKLDTLAVYAKTGDIELTLYENTLGLELATYENTRALEWATMRQTQYNVVYGIPVHEAITSGDNNVAVGYLALIHNSTGRGNTASGYKALYSNTEGDDNTASGTNALYYNTTGGNNTASGTNALYYNTTGGNNTALGPYALRSNTTASFSTAVGFEALRNANRRADVNAYNTALGYQAGNTGTNDITTGDKNVLIGSSTAASKAAATNQIVIGHGASGTADNSAVIGNSDITSVYAASDGSAILYAYGIIQSSDRRVKKSINTLAYGLNFIMKLRPVSYYKLHPRNYPQELKDKFYPDGKIRQVGAEDYDKLQVGFIAQEVKAVNDEMHAENNIVSIDEDGFHRMDYEKIVVPLVKAVQEQQGQIDELRAQIKSLLAVQTQTPSDETMTGSDQ